MPRLTISGRRPSARSVRSSDPLASPWEMTLPICHSEYTRTCGSWRFFLHEVSPQARRTIREIGVDSPMAPRGPYPDPVSLLPGPRLHVSRPRRVDQDASPKHGEPAAWGKRRERICGEALTRRAKHGTTPLAFAPGTYALFTADP
jgi:hypothetical protein